MYKRKYNPSHKKINLAGRIVTITTPDGEEKLKVKINAPALYDHFLKSYGKDGDWVSMEVKLKRPKRSESQNSFYHVYIDLISLSCGHSHEELHAWVKEQILGKGIKEIFGQKTRIVGSTTDLTIPEFCEMMNRIFDLTDIPIPDPKLFNLPMSYDEYNNLKEIQKTEYASYEKENKLSKKSKKHIKNRSSEKK